jgi:hypothetical protein
MVTCSICGWCHLAEQVALVPPIKIITEGHKVPLEDINLAAHALCQRCAKKVSFGCAEARFYPFRVTEREIKRRIAEAEEQARLRAERLNALELEAARVRRTGCWSYVPVLPAAEVKTVGKNGHELRGAARAAVVRRALRPIRDAEAAERERRKAAKAARRAAEKAARELKAERAAQVFAEIRA